MNLGRPQALKQVNLSAVRKAILDMGTATRAEIVEETQISVTTVRALLMEMEAAGEIEPAGQDDSSGGRKAVRYQLCTGRHYGACLCITGEQVRWFTVDIRGEICEAGKLDGGAADTGAIFALLDSLKQRLPLRVIGIGVPGIPDGLDYLRKKDGSQTERFSLGRMVQARYEIPVVLENDLGAIAYGFARCYRSQYPDEACQDIHMAYLHFEKGCLSAGFISNGQLIRGRNNYSGELGLYPVSDTVTLDDALDAPQPGREYAQTVARVLAGICCVLNPQYIALGGSGFRRACLPLIEECYRHMLATEMTAELLYADDVWHDYQQGMAAITAQHMFPQVHLVSS